MAMGKPIKAAKGGSMSMGKAPMRSMPVANAFPMRKAKGGSAIADRQGRALMAGKMAKNLPMIAPQSAYAKGGEAKPSSYDRKQDMAMQNHAKKPMGVAHKAAKKKHGGVMEKSSGEKYASKAAMKRHEAKETPSMEKAEHKKRGGMTKAPFSRC
jgi:hypothetical protein